MHSTCPHRRRWSCVRPRTGLALAFLCALSRPAAPQPAATNKPPETFFLETVVKGDPCRDVVERVRLEMRRTEDALVSLYRSDRDSDSEFVSITTRHDGRLLSATGIEQDHAGRETVRSRMWMDGETVHVERVRASGRRSLRSRAAAGRDVVPDAGLLFRLRRFPFDSGRTEEVMIAALSQHFVTMRIRQVGRETVETPAGMFDCYKLVGAVDLIVKEIATEYWVSAEPPHYLVKYEGKRSLFVAPTYTTSLVAAE